MFRRGRPPQPAFESNMDAALYFELVDAVASVDGEAELAATAARVLATPMHPLERRVLARAIRARADALAVQCQFVMPELLHTGALEATPLAAR